MLRAKLDAARSCDAEEQAHLHQLNERVDQLTADNRKLTFENRNLKTEQQFLLAQISSEKDRAAARASRLSLSVHFTGTFPYSPQVAIDDSTRFWNRAMERGNGPCASGGTMVDNLMDARRRSLRPCKSETASAFQVLDGFSWTYHVLELKNVFSLDASAAATGGRPRRSVQSAASGSGRAVGGVAGGAVAEPAARVDVERGQLRQQPQRRFVDVARRPLTATRRRPLLRLRGRGRRAVQQLLPPPHERRCARPPSPWASCFQNWSLLEQASGAATTWPDLASANCSGATRCSRRTCARPTPSKSTTSDCGASTRRLRRCPSPSTARRRRCPPVLDLSETLGRQPVLTKASLCACHSQFPTTNSSWWRRRR